MKDASKNRSNFIAHVNSSHAVRESLDCTNCGQHFPSQREKRKHICDCFGNLENPTRYQIKALDSIVGKTVSDGLDSLGIYNLCYNEKWCIPSIYPPFNVGIQLRKWPFNDWGNTEGTDFLLSVLTDMWNLPVRQEFLYLDKNIHILRPDAHTIPLGGLVTIPDKWYFNTEEVPGNLLRVSLKDPPEVIDQGPELAQLHATPSLLEFHKYTKQKNPLLKYNPHEWPNKARREINTKLNVNALPGSFIYHYGFVSLLTFWEWVQILAENNIQSRRKLPLPSILLMTLMRARRGFSLHMCSLEFEFTDELVLDDLFYACATILVDKLLTVPRLWVSTNVTEEDRSAYFEDLMANTDPLFQLIAGNFADMTGM